MSGSGERGGSTHPPNYDRPLPAGVAPAPAVTQRRKQRLRVLRIGGIECFGEPVVELREERSCVVPPCLIRPQLGQTCGLLREQIH